MNPPLFFIDFLLIQPLENRAAEKEGGEATEAAGHHLEVFLVEDLASWSYLFHRGLLTVDLYILI